jgi:hypothetical protein
MTDAPLFAHACPQHPVSEIREVTCAPATGGWLLTATYACGHRHTRLSDLRPQFVRDTRGADHPVEEEKPA